MYISLYGITVLTIEWADMYNTGEIYIYDKKERVILQRIRKKERGNWQ